MKLKIFGFFLGLVFVIGSSGCGLLGFGGEDEGDKEIGLMDFGDDPVEEDFSGAGAEAEVDFVLGLTQRPEILVEISYIYGHEIRLESLRRNNRDLQALLKYSSPGEIDLDWVREVHRVTRQSDELYRRLASEKIPPSQEEFYGGLQRGMLEVIQIGAVGSDRLLAASLEIGPSGRTLVNLTEVERGEFLSFMRQAGFFLAQSESFLEEEIEDVQGISSNFSLR